MSESFIGNSLRVRMILFKDNALWAHLNYYRDGFLSSDENLLLISCSNEK